MSFEEWEGATADGATGAHCEARLGAASAPPIGGALRLLSNHFSRPFPLLVSSSHRMYSSWLER